MLRVLTHAKSQLILKGQVIFFSILPNRNFLPFRLGQKFEFSSTFFGRIEDTKKTFRN